MGFLRVSEVGILLGIEKKQIKLAHLKGFLPEPPRIDGFCAYDLADVLCVAEYFGVKVRKKANIVIKETMDENT